MMKKMFGSLVLTFVLILLAGCTGSEQDNASKDEPENTQGNNVSADDDHRIIAGTVVVANILDQLNLDAIAVPDTVKELPKRFDGLPDIGNAMDPDGETVKALNPTDVITVSTLKSDLQEPFEKLKIPATFLDLTSVDSMMSEITKLGEKYNRVKEARALNDKLQSEIDQVKKVADNHQGEKPKVLILLGIPGSYIVGTDLSYPGDLVRLAGGENVMSGHDAEYLPANTEYLYDSNPDIILRLAHGMPDEVVKMFDEEFKSNDIWQHFDAVKNGRVYDMDEELFGTTAALNVPEALQTLVDIFYNNK